MSTGVDLKTYLQQIIIVTIGVAGVLAVVMIVICGIKMMTSGAVSGKSEAKECIWNAIFGLLIAIAAWALLYTINPELLRSDVQFADIPVPVSPPAPTGSIAPMPTVPGWYFRFIDNSDASGSTKNSPRFDTSEACVAITNTYRNSGITIIQIPAGGGTIECFQIVAPPPGTPTPPPPTPGTPPPPPTAPPIGGGSETAARQFLCGNNSCVGSTPVGVNRNACVGTSIATGFHCTNLAGEPQDALQTIKSLASAGGGNITVTGGTENGHASHGPNIPVFDLAKTSQLSNFIKTNATIKNNPSFCSAGGGNCHFKWLYNGYWYTDEDSAHFHVCKDGTTAPSGKSVALFQKACTKR
jgi:hypothetical protein